MNEIKRPDKLVILGGDVKDVKILSESCAITITRCEHTDPMLNGLDVRLESFIANGTTDRVFYPYVKPSTSAVVAPDLRNPDFQSAVNYAKSRGVTDKMIEAILRAGWPVSDDLARVDDEPDDDPEWSPHIGEWMRWAEEHPEALHPVIKAAATSVNGSELHEFDGNMERTIQECAWDHCYRMVHDKDAHFIEAKRDDGYTQTIRVCRCCAELYGDGHE